MEKLLSSNIMVYKYRKYKKYRKYTNLFTYYIRYPGLLPVNFVIII